MQSIQDNINDDDIKKKFTELRQELGDKLKYNADELCEIFKELKQNGYVINGFLGSGTEGPVFSVINNGNQIAVKVISGSDASKIDTELKIMEAFKNQPYIHQFIKAFCSESKKYFFYLTEKLTCDLESIMLLMKSKKQKLSYNQIIAFAIQMATALSILESNKVIHSDLKPANILYDQNNKCFKISDYGFSKIILQRIQQSISATQKIYGFTPKYAAPEILQESKDYSCKIDVYSLGLILLELIYGELLNVLQAMQILGGGASHISNYLNKDKQYDSMNKLIQSMLIIDRKSRISSQDVLQQFKSLQKNEESNLHKQLEAVQVDEATFQNMKQMYSASLSQISIDYIKDTTKQINLNYLALQQQQQLNQQQTIQPILKKQHQQLKFRDETRPVKQLTEVEEALAKYQNDINVSLGVELHLANYRFELSQLGESVVASRLASGLEKCSLSITSLGLKFKFLQIGPEGMKSISQSIGMMHQNLLVVGLEFDNCRMDPDEIKYLSSGLGKCDKMTTLKLKLYGVNAIGPTGACYLASSLPKCKSLTEFALSLKGCYIQAEGLQSLGSGLEKCEKLTRLNVQIYDQSKESPINEQSIEEFGSSLARGCPNLITLSVEFNLYPQYIAYAITPSLPLFTKLTTLTLFLGGQDAENISTLKTNLNKCYNLTSLCLSLESSYENKWSLGNAVSLVESLEEGNNLTTLKLVFHGFSFDEQANRLGESLSKFKKLTSLYLFFYGSEDNPTQFISALLSNHLAKNKSITTLSLGVSCIYDYGLTSSDSQRIGESLEKCKYLQKLHLYLWHNEIKSEGALAISKSLSKCVHLTALDLSMIEDYCCEGGGYGHHHVYTKYMDSVSSPITNDLKKCKNLEELKVKVRSAKYIEDFDRKRLIKLGILTKFESNFR